ncbi:MAG TPA: hypothetical protein VNZ49_16140 [Bacteroidia bacterium]|jgi:hypothetical protein|nr:hypothetical protein [Bacteroidia bacterium]
MPYIRGLTTITGAGTITQGLTARIGTTGATTTTLEGAHALRLQMQAISTINLLTVFMISCFNT